MYLLLTSHLSDKLNKAVFLDSSEETISSFQTYSFEQGDAERPVKSVWPQIMRLSWGVQCLLLSVCEANLSQVIVLL